MTPAGILNLIGGMAPAIVETVRTTADRTSEAGCSAACFFCFCRSR